MAKSFKILHEALQRKLNRIFSNGSKDPADDGPEVKIILREQKIEREGK